jgi:hypothetical protein
MGDVVALPSGTAGNSSFPSNDILPAWPHPRHVTLSIESLRQVDRDIRHLDAVMARARDVATISAILSTIYGANSYAADRAARKIGDWLRTGRIPA